MTFKPGSRGIGLITVSVLITKGETNYKVIP